MGRPFRKIRFIFLTVLCLRVHGPVNAAPAPAAKVWGYALNSTVKTSRKTYWEKRLPTLEVLCLSSFRISHQGIRADGEADAEILALARGRGVKIYPLLSLKNAREGKKILQNKKTIALAAKRAAELAGGFDGLHVDFEFMSAEYAPSFRIFLLETKKHLAGKKLSVAAVPPIFHNAEAVSFHAPGILSVADETVFMFYDLHYPTGNAGPVTSVKWVADNLAYLQQLGFSLKTTWLGTPLYGYAWKKTGRARVVSRRYAERNKQNARIHESGCLELAPKAGEIAYVAGDGIDNEFRRLAAQHGLLGLAYWRLGFE